MKIYCIEDINDLKYVGKSKRKLYQRLSEHKSEKYQKDKMKSSASKLHLENSIIYELEECEEDLSREREKYWINKLDCVNDRKLNYDPNIYIQRQLREFNQFL